MDMVKVRYLGDNLALLSSDSTSNGLRASLRLLSHGQMHL